MAAEFQLIVERILDKFENKINILKEKQNKCRSQVNELYKNDIKIRDTLLVECDKDVNNFNDYIKKYKEQQINSMTEICYTQLSNVNSIEYKTAKLECIKNQIGNCVVFEQNVQNKLNQ